MRNKVVKILSVAIFAAAVGLVFADRTFAAEFMFEAPDRIHVGNPFALSVLLNASDEILNAVSGEISFSADLLEMNEIRSGDSLVSFWIDPPKVGNGEVNFSGMIPGGYDGQGGRLFTVVFTPKKTGSSQIVFSQIMALLNDGRGTEAATTTIPWSFEIVPADATAPVTPIVVDTVPPETFAPEIATAQNIFNGAYFLAFMTQDKDSGIDHYELRESRNAARSESWVTALSPYLLKDQELKSYIWVKAVDKSGNTRVAELAPTHSLAWYELPPRWCIMILIAIFAFILFAWRAIVRQKR